MRPQRWALVDGGGGGGACGSGRGNSWDDPLHSYSRDFRFLRKDVTDGKTDRRKDPLIEMRGRI